MRGIERGGDAGLSADGRAPRAGGRHVGGAPSVAAPTFVNRLRIPRTLVDRFGFFFSAFYDDTNRNQ